jgi:hypothetical protein
MLYIIVIEKDKRKNEIRIPTDLLNSREIVIESLIENFGEIMKRPTTQKEELKERR